MADVLTIDDLIADKKHSTFFAEVITGKTGGLSTGADITTATNQVTGQVQKTIPAIVQTVESDHAAQMQSFEDDFDSRLAGMAFTRVGTFTAGATLTDMRQTLLWEVSQGGDGHAYGWAGAFPKVVAAGSTPATSGGVGAGAWVDRTDDTLRGDLILGLVRSRGGHLSLRDFASIKDYGVNGDGVTDVSSVFTLAFSENDVVYAPTPDVSYVISSITIPTGKSLITDGYSTIFQQVVGVSEGTRMIKVGGSNVYVGSCTCIGNIATDTNEQNHAVYVQSDSTSGNIYNVTIGNITGKNLRGDVVYIGNTTGYMIYNVSIGDIVYDNILRNGLTVIGVDGLTVNSITGNYIGLHAFDLEPNVGSGTVKNVTIGRVKGRSIGINGPTASDYIDNVKIGLCDLSTNHAARCTPDYTVANVKDAVQIRNVKYARIDVLKIDSYEKFAINYIYNNGELGAEWLDIGYLYSKNCSTNDTTYNSYIQVPSIAGNKLTIGCIDGSVYGNNKRFIDSAKNLRIGFANIDVSDSASFLRNCSDVVIDKLTLYGTTGTAFMGCSNVKVSGGRFDGSVLASYSLKCSFSNFTATATTYLFNSGYDNHAVSNSTLNGVYYANGTLAASGYTAPIWIGAYALWVSSRGKLYVKNGTPSSDTDGTIVGTQS